MSLGTVCADIKKNLCPGCEMTVLNHHKATLKLQLARDLLLGGQMLSPNAKSTLIYCGIMCLRSCLSSTQSIDNVEMIKTTITLLFCLFVLSTTNDLLHDSNDVAHDDTLATWLSASFEDSVASGSNAHSVVCESRIAHASLQAATLNASTHDMKSLESLAHLFFSCKSSEMIRLAMVAAIPDNSSCPVLSLGSLSSLDGELRQSQLQAIVAAAESESGQSVCRALHP